MKLASTEQMRECDRLAMEVYGISGLVLMENAGRAVVEVLERRFGAQVGREIAIFAGPGNNGGDALVIARYLYQRGAKPWVLLLVKPDKLKGDAAANLRLLRELPVALEVVASAQDLSALAQRVMAAHLVVDGIFGTGLSRMVSGRFRAAIELINDFAGPVVAVDTPSGLDSDRGVALGAAVRAHCTVSLALAKPGLVTLPGRKWAGDVEVVDIGIPQEVYSKLDLQWRLLEPADLAAWLPQRKEDSHKGNFGHLLLLAGSAGKTGAALLAAYGALRSGVGLVSACVPQPLAPILAGALWELMIEPLPTSCAVASVADLSVIEAALAGKRAMVLGPGLGTALETAELVQVLYREQRLPMVLDADALNVMAWETTGSYLLAQPSASAGARILTPHPGEMARLLGITSRQVQENRGPLAIELAARAGVFVVLKGAETIIASPTGELAVNPTGNPGMAVGGMGDVLAGLIGGLLCQGLAPWPAACLGVYVHGLAGDILARNSGINFGFTASELARTLPAAFAQLQIKKEK
ncbi:MAG: NAD(P)H-hydrate dehydratase [Desulfobulbaceae bacterium]|nr:MAG: NAD(P)H-hydrate dehydratase [Desulfobulbaceae bacterium]